ncbi:MAG: translocation/assembly module TamB domain-containing protein, partial [Microcystaceae cyanobacterium]
QGQVNVDIQGTLNQPIINGVATVNNATFEAQALTDPLTNVTGTVQFNGDTLTVEGLQGVYNQGNVTAAGILPIFANQAAQQQAATNPLTVSVNNLNLNVQGLYQGGVTGDVVIRGTARSPDIGGKIQLSNGQVVIGQSNTASAKPSGTKRTTDNATKTFSVQEATRTGETSTPDGTTTTFDVEPAGTQDNAAASATPPNLPITFNNLQIVLDKDVRVSTQPILGGFVPGGELSPSILSFDAKGDLTINGPLAKPRPEGVIRLTGGQFNLFRTQFTLERGYEHTAEFTPTQRLDPNLDVRLVAIVSETSGGTGSCTLKSPFSSEISEACETKPGALRTIRVRARATGPASQLSDNLELTSEPNRSQGEIISLLGGSIINSISSLGESDATTGIASLAGSTIFGRLQGSISAIGQAIGFSEFRIYPTSVSKQTSRPNQTSDSKQGNKDKEAEISSVLGLTAEGVFDLSKNFSVSLSRVFLTDEPFRYNIIYRVNDDVLVRGSTSLSDDSRLQVDYETRF